MKKSVNSNIYGYALDSTWECFGELLSGAHDALACIVSERPLSARARDAFEKSFAKLGYGEAACTYVTLTGNGGSDGDLRLGANDLFALIEGLDPLALVAADARAAELLGKAYRAGFDGNRQARLLGRTAIAFVSFDAMLDSPEDKQRAWAALKHLGLP